MNSHAPEEDGVNKPLVTFALFAYNQEAYIREAMEGALSQTYEPLEIVFSDDRSSDRTFEIMQEVVASYKGPHSIHLRRSQENRGLLGHINEAARSFSGEIVLMAAGDDVSAPHRTARVISAFLSSDDVMAVYTDVTEASTTAVLKDETARKLDVVSLYESVFRGGGVGLGAAYAYRRKCFFWPTDLPAHIYSEDRILPLRAAMLGRVVYLPEALVFYRRLNTGATSALIKKGNRSPLDWPPHVSAVLSELSEGRKAGKITSFECFRCSLAIQSRHHSRRLGPGKSPASRLLIRSLRGCVTVFFRMLIPYRRHIKLIS